MMAKASFFESKVPNRRMMSKVKSSKYINNNKTTTKRNDSFIQDFLFFLLIISLIYFKRLRASCSFADCSACEMVCSDNGTSCDEADVRRVTRVARTVGSDSKRILENVLKWLVWILTDSTK